MILVLLGLYVIPPKAAAILFMAPAGMGLIFMFWCDAFDIVSRDLAFHWAFAITIVLSFACIVLLIFLSGPIGWSIPLSATFIFFVGKIFGAF